MKKIRPFCRCGCGRRVRKMCNTWATPACVPREARGEWARIGRRDAAYRHRARLFRGLLAQLPQRCTREDLLTVLRQVYRLGYVAGFHQSKWTAQRAARRAA